MGRTNYSMGHEAEEHAASYLAKLGYGIHEINWRTRFCEIDIIAKKNNTVYFVEVKYRKNDRQGRGLDYITPQKVRQMQFAAELWIQENNWHHSYQLAAVEMTGEYFTVTSFIPNIL